MAIRKIIEESDEILRKISKPVSDYDDSLGVLIDDMFETLAKAQGAGLSAVQVGVLKRVFVMDAGHGKRECVNPKILKQEGSNKIKVEGCLSIPGKCGLVERPEKVTVTYEDRFGNTIKKKFSGFEAKCFCHEFDHLDGILYIDRATKMFKDREEYKKSVKEEERKAGASKQSNDASSPNGSALKQSAVSKQGKGTSKNSSVK